MNIEEKNNIYTSDQLSKIYWDTVNYFESNKSLLTLRNSETYKTGKKIQPLIQNHFKTLLEVTKEDSFTAAQRYVKNGKHPLVLNFANEYTPGGGVRKGLVAQEEELFRRSNYFQTLNKEFVNYPLTNTIIYSPDVYVIKDSYYKILKEPFKVSCIAGSAPKKPQVNINYHGKQRFLNLEDRENMKKSIETVLDVSIYKKHVSIILGDWGCETFTCPIDDIVELFQKALNDRYGYFENVCFAISTKNKHFQNNYEKFLKLKI